MADKGETAVRNDGQHSREPLGGDLDGVVLGKLVSDLDFDGVDGDE